MRSSDRRVTGAERVLRFRKLQGVCDSEDAASHPEEPPAVVTGAPSCEDRGRRVGRQVSRVRGPATR